MSYPPVLVSAIVDGTNTSPSISFANDKTSGVYRRTLDSSLGVVRSGTEVGVLCERLSLISFRQTADGTDWAPAIQRAHNFLVTTNQPGMIVEIPANTNMIWASQVNITQGFRLKGQGPNASVFNISTVLTVPYLDADNTNGMWLEDFTMAFAQPDSASISAMIQYPWAISLVNGSRFRAFNFRIQHGWNGITFGSSGGGSSGGAICWNLETSCYGTNVLIDGAADSMRFLSWHCWPWGSTANQIAAAQTSNTIGLHSLRCDDLHCDQCLWFGGQNSAVIFGLGNGSLPGPTFGTLTSCDLDNFGSIQISAGNINVVGGSITLGDGASQAFAVSGTGVLTLVGTEIGIADVPTAGFVGSVSTGGMLLGDFTVQKDTDVTVLLLAGGTSTVRMTVNEVNTTTAYTQPLVSVTGGSGTIEINATPHTVTAGRPGIAFIGAFPYCVKGNFNNRRIDTNTALNQVDCDIIGATSPIIAAIVVAPTRKVAVFPLTLDGSGNIAYAHGIPNLPFYGYVNTWAYYKNTSGATLSMALTSIDSTHINFSGGVAGQPCKINIEYIAELNSW